MFLDPTSNPVMTQVTLSAIVVAGMQWLKNSKWFPLLTAESAKVNRVVAALAAAGAAVGVHMVWAHPTDGTYVLTFSGLTLMGVLSGAWAWLKSFALQEMMFRATVKPEALVSQKP